MKAKYLKPTTNVVKCATRELMISASGGNGSTVWDYGGTTAGGGITSGDARWHNKLWDTDEDDVLF